MGDLLSIEPLSDLVGTLRLLLLSVRDDAEALQSEVLWDSLNKCIENVRDADLALLDTTIERLPQQTVDGFLGDIDEFYKLIRAARTRIHDDEPHAALAYVDAALTAIERLSNDIQSTVSEQ